MCDTALKTLSCGYSHRRSRSVPMAFAPNVDHEGMAGRAHDDARLGGHHLLVRTSHAGTAQCHEAVAMLEE